MAEITLEIQQRLLTLQDPAYQVFQCKLMPTVDPQKVIGVRTPLLRKMAKELAKREDIGDFLQNLPHRYYEENNLHGFIIEQIKDYDRVIAELNRFLPYVDNWATCDSMSPKIFSKNLPELYQQIQIWLKAEDIYTVRFAIGMLMGFFLDDAFDPEILEWVCAVRSEEYYIKMMAAWFIATALAKQYDAVLLILEQHKLEKWTHNKSIQKAIESYRITKEQKEYLRSLKQK